MPSRLLTRSRLAFGAIVAVALAAGFAGGLMAAQPHMHTALRALQHAKEQLQQADHDKDGYRDQAIGFVDQAIGAVQKGIAAGAK